MNEEDKTRSNIKYAPPGSDIAIDYGCLCPVLDNSGGLGYLGVAGHYLVNGECPLHGIPTDQVRSIQAEDQR